MKGNLYGVDIKLTPDNKPYVIEVNGQGSGTSGFVLAYGDLRTQRDIMSALAGYAGDKPIYRKSEIHDSDTSFSLKRAFLIALSKGAIALNQLWGRKSLDLQQDWLIQPYEQKREKKKRELPDEKYQTAAEELGLDFRPSRGITFIDSSTLRVRLDSRREEVVHPRDVGLIWSNHKAFSRTNEFDDVLVNPHYVQRFLNTKQYIHRLLEDSEIAEHLPQSVPYGMGIVHDTPALIGENGNIVYKPNSAAAGQGVRILLPADLEKVIDSEKAIKANERLRKFFDTYCGKSGRFTRKMVELELNAMEMYSYLLQEFIPSKAVRSSETEQDHDSCIRAIVFDGNFIDAYHRLSPTPLSGAEVSSKYIGNLSNGALAEPLSDSDKDFVAAFSEGVVRTLEDKLEGTNVQTKSDFEQYREDFWREELAKVV